MAMKMKGIYKSFKMVSQLFVVKERDMEIGHPTEVKHVNHVGWEVSSGSAPAWLSEFKAEAEPLSPIPSSFCHASNSKSLLTTYSSTDFDQRSSQLKTIADRPRDVPPIPVGLSKIHSKSKNRRKNSSSTTSPNPNCHLQNCQDQRVSKYSFKSMTCRSNSNA
ncbi:CRIB domain-containing protein RIC11 [Hirschfeldia incana]|nr:CRIB domain-containing protein RIC11 [Hirschfeldia incana]